MANLCMNDIFITHKDKEMMAKAIKAWNEGNFFATFIPEPDYTKVEVYPTFPEICGTNRVDPERAWHDWRLQNWGNKWELDSKEYPVEEADADCISTFIDTPWSPPIKAYEALTKLGFHIRAHYYEPSNAFCGTYESQSGDTCITIEGGLDWAEKNLPEEILDAFNILEDMDEHEQTNE